MKKLKMFSKSDLRSLFTLATLCTVKSLFHRALSLMHFEDELSKQIQWSNIMSKYKSKMVLSAIESKKQIETFLVTH